MIGLVEVKGYKCLRYIRQPLGRFHVLVGPNASGKSTFLDTLLFVRDLVRDDVESAVRARGRSVRELVWKGEGDAFEIALEFRAHGQVHVGPVGHRYDALRYELRVRGAVNGIHLDVENLWLVSDAARPGRERKEAQAQFFPWEREVPASVVIAPGKHAPKGWRKVMSRGKEGRVYVRSERTQWNIGLRPVAGRSGLTVIPDEEERFPAAVWLRRLLTESIQFLMLDSRAMRAPVPPDAPETYQPTGANLAKVVEGLQKNHPDRFRDWLRHVQTVLEDIEQITIRERPEDRFRYLVTRMRGGYEVPSWLLSDGTLRFLALTVLPYLPHAEGVYFVEEPENGIHPRALEALYQSLSSVYDGQVLCATHSAVLLNVAKLPELLCFARTENGGTSTVQGDKHPALKEWRKEVPLGDLLASGVLG